MNSTKPTSPSLALTAVWEICKFWILRNPQVGVAPYRQFERYVNFEFYETLYKFEDFEDCLRDM